MDGGDEWGTTAWETKARSEQTEQPYRAAVTTDLQYHRRACQPKRALRNQLTEYSVQHIETRSAFTTVPASTTDALDRSLG